MLTAVIRHNGARRAGYVTVAAVVRLPAQPRSLTCRTPHRAARVRYPLPALLALAMAALLANHLSVLAIAEWGRVRTPPCTSPSSSAPSWLAHKRLV